MGKGIGENVQKVGTRANLTINPELIMYLRRGDLNDGLARQTAYRSENE